MTEISKMYENAGFPKKQCKDYSCIVCEQYNDCKKYPPFTAEKKIELIKWLGENEDGFGFFNEGILGLSCQCDFYWEWFNKTFYAKDFDNALAGLINKLWQDLTDQEKEEIRNILNA